MGQPNGKHPHRGPHLQRHLVLKPVFVFQFSGVAGAHKILARNSRSLERFGPLNHGTHLSPNLKPSLFPFHTLLLAAADNSYTVGLTPELVRAAAPCS
jgi:hypothetical protein